MSVVISLSLVLSDRNLDNLPSESTEAKAQITEDLVLMRDFCENNATGIAGGIFFAFNPENCWSQQKEPAVTNYR